MHPLQGHACPEPEDASGRRIAEEEGMLAVPLSQGHTQPCCCMPVKEEENERDALPFLPLVLHPTLSSFPSRVHTVSEEGIHSREARIGGGGGGREGARGLESEGWREGGREREREGGASRKRAGGGRRGAACRGRWERCPISEPCCLLPLPLIRREKR